MNVLRRRYSIQCAFALILLVSTFALCEVSFRAYDWLTTSQDNLNSDVWIKNISKELEEHSLLGYRRVPNRIVDEMTQVDTFGMLNVREALAWQTVDVVGIGDSYVDLAHKVFFDRFKAYNLRYHSLAVFGYGPANYNVLMNEYGRTLSPKVYIYSVYLGNDPGDIRRYENWRATGKGWYEHNGGYVFPIQRQGLVWGWHLFLGRAKSFATRIISRVNAESYAALRGLVKRDDAETVFEYIHQAKKLAETHQAELLVVIVPRTADHKPLLDPIASKLVGLCAGKGVMVLDLDTAFDDAQNRDALFAADGHWNEAGMHVAWTYFWDTKLRLLLSPTAQYGVAAHGGIQ